MERGVVGAARMEGPVRGWRGLRDEQAVNSGGGSGHGSAGSQALCPQGRPTVTAALHRHQEWSDEQRPQRGHILLPGTCEAGTSLGQRHMHPGGGKHRGNGRPFTSLFTYNGVSFRGLLGGPLNASSAPSTLSTLFPALKRGPQDSGTKFWFGQKSSLGGPAEVMTCARITALQSFKGPCVVSPSLSSHRWF